MIRRMRPLIGVTTSELRPSAMATTRRHGEPPHPEMALGMTYLRTLERRGRDPRRAAAGRHRSPAPLLDRLDGICLSGGPDLDPPAYGATDRHAELGPTEPSLDAFELASPARRSRATCRSSPSAAAPRRSTSPAAARCTSTSTATARPTPATQADARGQRRGRLAPAPDHAHQAARVNSFHHQAVDSSASGLRVVARAADGTIEAIEGGRFTLGVQWHAETLTRHMPLFEALVRAAARTELRDRRMTPWGGCSPSACATSSSASAT